MLSIRDLTVNIMNLHHTESKSIFNFICCIHLMFVLFVTGMYQTDLQAEYDKIFKKITNPSEPSQTEQTKEPEFISVAKQHNDSLRHPSEVVIDLKVSF